MALSQSIVRDCIRREVRSAMPEKKKRGLAYHQIPLFAWIQGTRDNGTSRICRVKENKACWPWTTLNASGHEFVRRVSKKKRLTFVQRQMLYDYVACRYQGRYEYRFYTLQDVHNYVTDRKGVTHQVYGFIKKCLDKEGISQPPLKLILSQEFALLIDIKTLEYLL